METEKKNMHTRVSVLRERRPSEELTEKVVHELHPILVFLTRYQGCLVDWWLVKVVHVFIQLNDVHHT